MSYNESLNPNSNYPAMSQSQWDSAPWNEPSIPEIEVDITCSQSLSKTVPVTTDNYIPGASGVDYESDDEGGCCAVGWHDPDDFSETNWANEFSENDYHTPAQLLELFKECLEIMLQNNLPYKSERFTKDLMKECEDWTVDDEDYVKED